MLLRNGEVLPLPCGGENLELLNPRVVGGALELNASTVLRFGSGRIMRITKHILDANGEVLPLSTDDGVELFELNARVTDALDEANSSLTRFPGTNRIMHTGGGLVLAVNLD
jgi:hypothetical protein